VILCQWWVFFVFVFVFWFEIGQVEEGLHPDDWMAGLEGLVLKNLTSKIQRGSR
jgi:hypothetical protein